ncbi:hypothetical protein CSKR_114022 [Clonorchis sinensis]|uniref:Uncharacterized protein n=1 Tax=Clonorchis sinensis TaxID=79923 RepID=A0A419PSA8_CLOSI|nr:hypothetical protein CSKR_114022 [Clonorchis sinensis]
MRISRLSTEETTPTHATEPSFRSPLFGVRTLTLHCADLGGAFKIQMAVIRLSSMSPKDEFTRDGLLKRRTLLLIKCKSKHVQATQWKTVYLPQQLLEPAKPHKDNNKLLYSITS